MTVDDLFKGTPLHRDWTATQFRRARWLLLVIALLVVFVELMRPTRSTWLDLLLYLGTPAWCLSVLLPSAWPARPDAERSGDGFVLRYGRGWRYALRAAAIVPSAGIGLALLPKAAEEPVTAGVGLCILAAVVAFAILITRESFLVTASGVQRTSWTGRVTTLQWQDVTRCKVRGWPPRLVLGGPSRKLEVPLAFDGSGDFAMQVLSSLSATVLEAATNVRPVLEAVAARASARTPGSETRASPHQWTASIAAVAVLLATGLGTWSYSLGLETPLRVPIPSGWVDLSPGAHQGNFEGLPPSVRQQAKRHGVVAFAAERAADPGVFSDQALMVEIHNGELDVGSAARGLATDLAKAIPGARVESQRVESIAGIRAVRAEVSVSGGAVIMYAVPVIARTASVVFTCSATECGRIRRIAAATLSETQGLAEPTFGTRYTGPFLRSGAMLAILGALWLGIAALQVSLRRREPTTGVGPPAGVASTALVEEPGTLRRIALIVWSGLLAGSALSLGMAVFVQPRFTLSNASRGLAGTLAALSLLASGASLLVPRLVRIRPGSTPGSSALTSLIATAAACEASVLLGAFGYMLTGQRIALASAGTGVLAFLVAFPRARRWRSLRR